jgi:hypothetical protein
MIRTVVNQIHRDGSATLRRLLGVAASVAIVLATTGAPAVAEDDRNGEGVVRHTVACGGFHLVRVNNSVGLSEMFETNISVRNQNADDAVTIERITIHDAFGNAVYDGGPAVGVPLPLNTDFSPPLNITVVPPNANYYLFTRHIWGLQPMPAGNQNGFNLSIAVQYSTHGTADRVAVVGSSVVRQRIQTGPTSFAEGDEHTRVRHDCQRLK